MDSVAFQKQVKNNSADLQDFFKDLKDWGDDMKRKDESLKIVEVDDEIPLPRNKVKKLAEKPKKQKASTKRTTPFDYATWDKFDVEAECAKVDQAQDDKESEESDLTDENDESTREEGNYEKEKGNKFVKLQRWDDAIQCYSSAIKCYGYDPIYYANRALCYLKLEKLQNAESDCTTALQLDPTYVKAYQRRAAAREALNQLKEAHADLQQVLKYEPNNKESQNALLKLEKKLGGASELRPKSKFTLSREKMRVNKKTVAKIEPVEIPQSIEPSKEIIQSKIAKSQNEIANPKIDKPLIEEISYWLSGSDVELVKPIVKLPHLRSKKPLKRVKIRDVTMQEVKPIISNALRVDSLKVVERLENKKMDENQFDIPVPKSSVQFNTQWRLLKNQPELKYRYLVQVDPNSLSHIFKESMESEVFSDILQILSGKFIEEKRPVYEYLFGLTNLKRFSALVMFMSYEDKKAFLRTIDYLRNTYKGSQDNINTLIKKFEM